MKNCRRRLRRRHTAPYSIRVIALVFVPIFGHLFAGTANMLNKQNLNCAHALTKQHKNYDLIVDAFLCEYFINKLENKKRKR